jgi:hypothetical protein
VRRTNTLKPYPLGDDLCEPALRVAMLRALRLVAPGSTMHVVARGNGEILRIVNCEL